MHLTAISVLLAALTADPMEVGVEYRLDGKLTKVDGESGGADKKFQLALFADQAGGEKPQVVYWTLTESGRGQAPWLERFGAWNPFAESDANAPALYYARDEGLSIATLPPLALPDGDALKAGAKWSRGARAFEVVGDKTINDIACWKVQSRDAVGRRRDMLVEKESGLVVQMEQRLFLGQGERYELEWNVQRLSGASRVAPAAAIVRKLIALREASGWRRQSESAVLTEAQRRQFKQALPSLLADAKSSPVESVVNAARRDLLNQDERAETVAAMEKKAIGRNLVAAKLNDMLDKETSICNGRVTVLHFWEYREKPLKDPYGQSAYVDFFYRNRDPEAVDVFGVNVDSRLAVRATRSASIRSARRFRSFMNLSYPLLMDDGQLLRDLGDPRTTGAKLPLYVVLDPNGKVVAYKAGHFNVDPREGLKELNAAVKAAAKVR